MRLTRIVLPALLVAVLLSGCGGGTPSGTEPGKQGNDGKPGTPPVNMKDTEAGAKTFAAGFLTAVRDKKATAAQLTPEFKKVFAPPALEAEKAQGYSDTVADMELKALTAEVGADDVTAVAAADGAAFAVGKNKGGGRTLVRAVKVGNEWKADWLSVGPKGVAGATLSGDDAPAQFAVQAFIDAAVRKKHAHASALLTDAARNKLGEGTFEPKKFDAGKLATTLDGLFDGFDQYTVTKTAKDGSAVVVTVELPFAAGKKTGTLKAVKGTRPGEWLVDSVEVK